MIAALEIKDTASEIHYCILVFRSFQLLFASDDDVRLNEGVVDVCITG